MAATRISRLADLAPELGDDRQASVLYSPFRDKSLNPHSWNRKMKFWESLLQRTFMEQQMISFEVSKLPALFERNGLTPKCFTTVVEQMKSSGQLRPVSHYQRNSHGWLSWGFNALVKQPLYWGMSQMMWSGKKNDDVLVCPEVVKVLAEKVLQQHRSNTQFSVIDRLVSLVQLRESCQQLLPDGRDFDIVLTQLERDKQAALVQTKDGDVLIKFCKEGESAASFKELDLNLYSIKTTMEKLEKEIQTLSSRVDEYLKEARKDVKSGKKKLALLNLRRKASALKLIEKKSGSLTMLQDIVQKIEDATTNEMVVNACEAGMQAMKTLNEEVTAGRAEAIMDELQEAISNQEEVSDVLSSAMPTYDEEELERDLEALLREDHAQQKLPVDVSQQPSPEELPTCSDAMAVSEHDVPHIKPVSDDIVAAFLDLEIKDLGLPDVPTHSPSKDNNKDKAKKSSPNAVPSL